MLIVYGLALFRSRLFTTKCQRWCVLAPDGHTLNRRPAHERAHLEGMT